MRKIVLLTLTILLLVVPAAVQAQGEIEFERLQIDIWPEYDRQEVLIIYRFTLADEVSLPADLTLRIPTATVEPYNVAMLDVDGMLYNLEYTLKEEGDWLLVSFSTPSPSVQFEYYDPQLNRTENIRNYTYVWPGDYTIRSLSMVVQKPTNTLDFEIDPDMGTGTVQQDGLRYFSSMFGAVETDTNFTVNLTYDKPNNTLSANPQPVEPVAPIDDQTSGRTSFRSMLPWVLGGLALVVITGALGFWFGKPKGARQFSGRKRHSKTQEKKSPPNELEHTGIYCHQCGARGKPGDLFCRSCGAKLRLN